MVRKRSEMIVVLLAASVALSGVGLAAEIDKAKLDAAMNALPKYDWGASREPLNAIDGAIVATYGQADARKDLEKRLAALLGSDATRAAKQYVCRKLAIIGTADSVGALAALLPDEKLSHMARYALERIPGAAASDALRGAIGTVGGKLKVGMINSVGMRADPKAVGSLTGLLKASDATVAAAAAAALGRIGTVEAAAPLAEMLASAPKGLQTAAIDASLDLASRLLKNGNKAEAAKIYEKLHATDQPARVQRAALQGLVAVRPAESTGLLTKALSSDDPASRGLAVRMIKEIPGPDATKVFAGLLSKLSAVGQVALLDALAARKDAAARPAVLAAAKGSDASVRLAAIKALSTLGGAADVPMLAGKATGADKAEADAAKAALARLGGKDVDPAIVSCMGDSTPNVQTVLLGTLAARSATGCAPAVAKYTSDGDTAVRRAAIDAVGVLSDASQIPSLVRQVKAPKDPGDRASLEKALTAICTRVKDKGADPVIAGLSGADADASAILLRALGRAGGAEALQCVIGATKSSDATVQDAATRVLVDWQAAEAIAPVQAVAETTTNSTHKVLALRGFIRLIRAHKAGTADQLARIKTALALAPNAGEKRGALGALGDVQTVEALKLAAPLIAEPQLREEACAVATRIAERVWKKDKALTREVMTEVVGKTKNRRTKGSAQKVLNLVLPK
jgi:HEAT repeat protein